MLCCEHCCNPCANLFHFFFWIYHISPPKTKLQCSSKTWEKIELYDMWHSPRMDERINFNIGCKSTLHSTDMLWKDIEDSEATLIYILLRDYNNSTLNLRSLALAFKKCLFLLNEASLQQTLHSRHPSSHWKF